MNLLIDLIVISIYTQCLIFLLCRSSNNCALLNANQAGILSKYKISENALILENIDLL